ncbi:formylglycine-generating enzyme family protein [Sphaerothrix gracilis]|uniref:formylglycine-generating enzyme family protein n=1 Tax=Sphaerothrix gracilis TaxID=3151835 RepID=UPI0031FE3945
MADFVIQRERKQARYFTEDINGVGLDMILIPGGSFLMGSPGDEPERSDDEGPQYPVTVPTFLMGRYPVTQAQWKAVAALPQKERELDPDPSNFKGATRPVEQVSWYEAVEFCQRLAEYTKRPYRLPSEAEWEYACRAGTTTPFYFGKTLTAELANYNAEITYNGGPEGEYRGETTPVDKFGVANAFGLCDMHGNIFEWCEDHWHDSYESAPIDGSAWLTEEEEASRVLRGGSWDDVPRHCRSAFRYFDLPGDRLSNIGFRVVCSAPGSLQ